MICSFFFKLDFKTNTDNINVKNLASLNFLFNNCFNQQLYSLVIEYPYEFPHLEKIKYFWIFKNKAPKKTLKMLM